MKKYLGIMLLLSVTLLSACGTQPFAPGADSTNPHAIAQEQAGGGHA